MTTDQESNKELHMYRFFYRRKYDKKGNLISIPVSVRNGILRVRSTNLMENACMHLADHPVWAGLAGGIGVNAAIHAAQGHYEVAALEAAAAGAAFVGSGLLRELEAENLGVLPQQVR